MKALLFLALSHRGMGTQKARNENLSIISTKPCFSQ
jgi:hypothetical protein